MIFLFLFLFSLSAQEKIVRFWGGPWGLRPLAGPPQKRTIFSCAEREKKNEKKKIINQAAPPPLPLESPGAKSAAKSESQI